MSFSADKVVQYVTILVETSAECTQDECLPDQLLNVFINH
jgi:hypothetical protein